MIKKTHTHKYAYFEEISREANGVILQDLDFTVKTCPSRKSTEGFSFLRELNENDRVVSYKKRQGTGGGGGGWEEHTLYEGSLISLSSQMLGQKSRLVGLSSSHTHTHTHTE